LPGAAPEVAAGTAGTALADAPSDVAPEAAADAPRPGAQTAGPGVVSTEGPAAATTRTASRHGLIASMRRTADVHVHAGGVLRAIVVACMLAPLLLVPLRAFTHWWPRSPYMMVALALVMVFGLTLVGLIAGTELVALVRVVRYVDKRTGLQSVLMVLLGLAYATTVVQFVAQTARMELPMSAELLTRALQLGSGVTPLVPLIVGGAFLVVWAHQHARRAKWLRVQFAAEAWREPEAFALRRGLVSIDADRYTRIAAALVVVLGLWTLMNTQRSAESIPWTTRSVFDELHRTLIVGVLALTSWAVLRFMRTWSALRRELRTLAAQPFIEGMARLPASFGVLARLTPLDAPSPTHARTIMQTELDIRLRRLRTASLSAWERLFGASPGRIVGAFPDSDQQSGDVARKAARSLDASFRRGASFAWAADRYEDGTVARAAAEEIAAILAADYVTWVIRQLRHLAIGLLASVVLGTLFLACYPFEPHTFIRLCFFSVTGIGVATVAAVLIQMNRDPVLSRLTRTNIGEVTWDLPFLTNLLAIVGIPLLTLLGSQFPEVRDFLFGWLAPLLKTVGRS
jgi:hypothetical protein